MMAKRSDDHQIDIDLHFSLDGTVEKWQTLYSVRLTAKKPHGLTLAGIGGGLVHHQPPASHDVSIIIANHFSRARYVLSMWHR